MTNARRPDTAENKIIAIVGMAGSGKSEAAKYFQQHDYTILRFGDVIDNGISAEGLPWTPENNIYFRSKIRKELGMAAVAIKMLPDILKAVSAEKQIILDGLYSWEEYLYLKEHFPQLFLLGIYARPAIRYTRLEIRKERSFTKVEARQRDIHEIEKIHKAGPIAIADYLIKNETTMENFKEELDKFFNEETI